MIVLPGTPMAEIGRIFKLNQRSITRHRALHVSKLLRSDAALAHATSEAKHGGSLIDDAAAYEARARAVLEDAVNTRDHALALKAIRGALDCLEVRAKLTGQISNAPIINVFSSQTWITLQSNILAALNEHPAAYAAVLTALEHTPA